jgi:DNA polymerase-3 subunit delta
MRIIVLHGEERFLIQEYTKQLTAVLEEAFGGVDLFSFDGETASPAAVLDELRSYGLMQKHKLVILDNANVFLAGGKGQEETDDDEDRPVEAADGDAEKKTNTVRPMMERYAAAPVADATLLMRASSWRPGKIDKLAEKVGLVFKCEALPEARAVDWCIKRVLKRYDATIDRDAAELLVTRHGTSLQHLDVELVKLSSMAEPGKPITRQLVADNTILSKDEKAWVIQDAIATGDASTMLRKLHELVDVSRHAAVPLMWSACELMRKVHAASRLIRQGVPSGSLFGALKLWGGSGNAVIEWGQRLSPDQAAQLLQAAIDADRRSKSGLGEPQRNLEALMVTIADEVHSGA